VPTLSNLKRADASPPKCLNFPMSKFDCPFVSLVLRGQFLANNLRFSLQYNIFLFKV
jgi:hypothetical protein